MAAFRVDTSYRPTGDQPEAIESLSRLIKEGDRFQTLLGATGTGKSLGYDEPVLIVKESAAGPESRVVPIGPLIDQIIDKAEAKRDVGDALVIETQDLEESYLVQAFDPRTDEVGLYPVGAFIRHRAPERMYRVRTACGRMAVLTGDHNLWVLRNGRLQLIDTTDVREGDAIPLPERLLGEGSLNTLDVLDLQDSPSSYVQAHQPVLSFVAEEGSQPFHKAFSGRGRFSEAKLTAIRAGSKGGGLKVSDLRQLLVATDDLGGRWDPSAATVGGKAHNALPARAPLTTPLLSLLGYYLAEGCADLGTVRIANNDAKIRVEIGLALSEVQLDCKIDASNGDLRIHSTVLSSLLRKLCGERAAAKHLPAFWPQLSDSSLGTLLRAYFDGDGTVERAGAVSATTASEELANDLAYALLRLGLWARVGRVWKKAVGSAHAGDWYHKVTISGQEDLEGFRLKVGFGLSAKREALESLIGRRANSNVDVVPIAGAEVRWLRQGVGLTASALGAAALMSRSGVQLIETQKRKPQRRSLQRLLEALRAAAERQEVDDASWWDTWQRLRGLCGLRWTAIACLEEIRYEHPYVYDFSVPGPETFLGGRGGLFVHNTATMAWVIEQVQKPTLIIAHNKTLAAQLCNEFREFLPDNAVEYFVSYYDYYQPEAYMPSSDVYIEKDAQVNDDIDRLRHAATSALLSRRDVVIVASVSAIYGLGSPERYREKTVIVSLEEPVDRDLILRKLVDIQYVRHDILDRGRFRVRGDTIEVQPASQETAYRLTFFGDEVEEILHFNPLTGEPLDKLGHIVIYPATQYVTDPESIERATEAIGHELTDRLKVLEAESRLLEAHRLKQRTEYDVEMMQELGFCHGIENYSRHLEGRAPGTAPFTLLDYFPKDFICFIDESHVTVPQIGGMYEGDRSRKTTLIDYGFRLPSALDNRPLKFDEFLERVPQFLFVSATPGPFELENSTNVAEQIIRPTGVVDPEVEVRPTTYQVDDLLEEVRVRAERQERVLVTTLTKKMAEDLADYFLEAGIKAKYLHSDIETLERIQIIRELRLGEYDVLVGVNLLREGLDLPEVSLVAILDADKEGFLRGKTALIQTIGRAARNVRGHVIMYADRISNAMAFAISETDRRRAKQVAYNEEHGIVPQSIIKGVSDIAELLALEKPSVPRGRKKLKPSQMSQEDIEKALITLEEEMAAAAEELRFEYAAKLRDEIKALRRELQPL